MRPLADSEADTDFNNLGGGVSEFTVDKVTTSGSHATVAATETAWAAMAAKQPDGSWVTSSPSSKLQLDRTASGQWLVSGFDWTFAEGSAP